MQSKLGALMLAFLGLVCVALCIREVYANQARSLVAAEIKLYQGPRLLSELNPPGPKNLQLNAADEYVAAMFTVPDLYPTVLERARTAYGVFFVDGYQEYGDLHPEEREVFLEDCSGAFAHLALADGQVDCFYPLDHAKCPEFDGGELQLMPGFARVLALKIRALRLIGKDDDAARLLVAGLRWLNRFGPAYSFCTQRYVAIGLREIAIAAKGMKLNSSAAASVDESRARLAARWKAAMQHQWATVHDLFHSRKSEMRREFYSNAPRSTIVAYGLGGEYAWASDELECLQLIREAAGTPPTSLRLYTSKWYAARSVFGTEAYLLKVTQDADSALQDLQ